LSSGVVTGVFVYFFGAGLQLFELLGANAFVVAAHLVGDNLRHSHVALRYPDWLERILISPAQHQYHHTLDGSRRNYGGVLALWDFLFGSLHLSTRNDTYRFGIEDPLGHRTVAGLLLTPLSEILSKFTRLFIIRSSYHEKT
jgi:sterol desaturase/sphingolipid hydroxylase (fatty acid hydroxylase superfamily)